MNTYFTLPVVGKLSAIIFCFYIFITLPSFSATGAKSKGVDFANTLTTGNNQLLLHGIGLLKWKYLINVYLVGLYKPDTVTVDQLHKNVPKSLEYYFFVDMKAEDFQRTGFELMARNIGQEKAQKLTRELEAFNNLYQDVKAGQRYRLTFIPGQGLEMALDGEVLGLVEGDDFGSAYLSIWLGKDPVSKTLQKGMFDSSTIER